MKNKPVKMSALKFFRDNAGYVVGKRALGALHMARAEAYAEAHGWTVEWEWDDITIDDHAVWCPVARAFERGFHDDGTRVSSYSKGPRCEHDVEYAALKDADGNVLGGLGGNIDVKTSDRRVIAAELASEALAEIRAKQAKRRDAKAFVSRNFAL